MCTFKTFIFFYYPYVYVLIIFGAYQKDLESIRKSEERKRREALLLLKTNKSTSDLKNLGHISHKLTPKSSVTNLINS